MRNFSWIKGVLAPRKSKEKMCKWAKRQGHRFSIPSIKTSHTNGQQRTPPPTLHPSRLPFQKTLSQSIAKIFDTAASDEKG
ncbi:hypothetical protein CEXT_569511 [Caerostris extrusa]|uniref:Uncharacterized protein n=1 Tax=Caerostris extrusa TaxID=172846 RepID=A0AAV4RIP5_CAEEX|nr:hypothetical protein CEXT_569511 [Caerostris extrusa]